MVILILDYKSIYTNIYLFNIPTFAAKRPLKLLTVLSFLDVPTNHHLNRIFGLPCIYMWFNSQSLPALPDIVASPSAKCFLLEFII